jgi:hypothetical protein
MRTVTFSTPEIQDTIARQFVALNTNIQGDPLAGESIAHAPREQPGFCIRGNGRQNVQTIFMTPDLEIFHVATGYMPPQDMLQEMQFASELFASLQTNPDDRFQLVRTAHQQRLDQPTAGGSSGQPGGSFEEMINSLSRGQAPTNGMADPMQMFVDRSIADDQRYMVQQPLIRLASFESDPGALVGRGKTFFSSSSNFSNGFNPGR